MRVAEHIHRSIVRRGVRDIGGEDRAVGHDGVGAGNGLRDIHWVGLQTMLLDRGVSEGIIQYGSVGDGYRSSRLLG